MILISPTAHEIKADIEYGIKLEQAKRLKSCKKILLSQKHFSFYIYRVSQKNALEAHTKGQA